MVIQVNGYRFFGERTGEIIAIFTCYGMVLQGSSWWLSFPFNQRVLVLKITSVSEIEQGVVNFIM